jgi:hypothetical protein
MLLKSSLPSCSLANTPALAISVSSFVIFAALRRRPSAFSDAMSVTSTPASACTPSASRSLDLMRHAAIT